VVEVITFVSQKGGTGKSTLACCCAVAAEEIGRRVLLLDLDEQATAEAWYQNREAETPRLVKVTAPQLEDAVSTARAEGFDMVLIDTPGRDELSTTAAIRVADFCIISCRPSATDMRATPPTVTTIERLHKPFAFVLTQTPARGYRIHEAEQGLGVLGLVAPVRTALRTTYQDSLAGGLGPTEFDPESKAAEEVRALWLWIEKKVRKGHYARQSQKNVA
jgi:chromosome partitioning protein